MNIQREMIQEAEILRLVGQVVLNLGRVMAGGEVDRVFVRVGHSL